MSRSTGMPSDAPRASSFSRELLHRLPHGAVAIDPLHEKVERGLATCGVRMIDKPDHDPAPTFGVDHVTGKSAHAFERAGFQERLPGHGAVLKTALHSAVERC